MTAGCPVNHRLSKTPNHPTLMDRILLAIEQQELVPAGCGVLVGVSGGPDSMALLHLLHGLDLFPLRVAHLNHQLRPGACDADEAMVRTFCQTHAIDFVSQSVDVAVFASQYGLGLEAAGRACRHQFFADCVQQWLAKRNDLKAVRIALAHHLDDQAETILLHLGRGCGLAGLSGMAPGNGPFIRPLLGIRRQEILDYLASHAVPYHLDHTNDDPFTQRNRLRQTLLPAWQNILGFDPAAGLARMADLVREDESYLNEQARIAFRALSQSQASDSASMAASGLPSVHLDRMLFRGQHPAIQNRILRLCWRKVSGQDRDIEWRHLKLARDLILEKRARGHLDWPSGVVLDLSEPIVRFSQTKDQPSDINSLHKVAFVTRIQDDRLL
ncbi:MAG: tRNA lysidine(34) synthetase TilS [Clostridia bacterium]|nr:tRNA lysidine(34) synthetase TilS [Clostridia bacterium]